MQLLTLLEQQKQLLNDLLVILDAEKDAIAARQSTDIEQQAKEKLAKLNQIQQQDAIIGRHPDKAQLKEDDALKGLVGELEALLNTCHMHNEVNGEALQRAQLSFHKLNNLFQQSRGKSQMGYNSEGVATNIRSLGTNIKA
ncbi:flagella synthesis protein FlgN [Thaumasiovibrio subtropicus]|uniref:flagella synthesis protein FlgN n=1 Tax=Thaumasiovibrio subtropicus TaxID=1891207 RepID=UPI000B35CBD1|nr:flagellar export chaperone FlgN [Thaumasiovibrio subtropicus]